MGVATAAEQPTNCLLVTTWFYNHIGIANRSTVIPNVHMDMDAHEFDSLFVETVGNAPMHAVLCDPCHHAPW